MVGTSTFDYDDHRLDSRTDSAVDATPGVDPPDSEDGTISFGYDRFGRLDEVTDPFTHAATTYDLDDSGRVTSRDDPSGLVHTYGYDQDAGWLANEEVNDSGDNGRDVADFSYDYNPNSAITKRTQGIENSPDNGEWTYGYDPAGRMISADMDAETPAHDANLDYSYDGMGNRYRVTDTKTVGSDPQVTEKTTTTTKFDRASRPAEATRRIEVDGELEAEMTIATYSHDEVGNMTAVHQTDPLDPRHWDYEYDPWSRLTQASLAIVDLPGEEEPVVEPLGISYDHDALDRTVSQSQIPLPGGGPDQPSLETQYFYGGDSDEELVASSVAVDFPTTPDPEITTTTFAHAMGQPLAERTQVAGVAVDQMPISYYGIGPHQDVNYMTDGKGPASGETLSTKTYDPWGAIRTDTDPVGVIASSSFGFQGELTDARTELVDMGARNYDPSLGAFTTVDPVEAKDDAPLSYNPYIYGLDSPVTMTDPTGRCPYGSDRYVCDDSNDSDGNNSRRQSENRITNPLDYSTRIRAVEAVMLEASQAFDVPPSVLAGIQVTEWVLDAQSHGERAAEAVLGRSACGWPLLNRTF